jgi:hypothetical protein
MEKIGRSALSVGLCHGLGGGAIAKCARQGHGDQHDGSEANSMCPPLEAGCIFQLALLAIGQHSVCVRRGNV